MRISRATRPAGRGSSPVARNSSCSTGQAPRSHRTRSSLPAIPFATTCTRFSQPRSPSPMKPNLVWSIALARLVRWVTWRSGVDTLSFGFVKNGGLNAEALILFRTELADEIAVRRKRAGHLLSKGRVLAAQILALLEGNLWLE